MISLQQTLLVSFDFRGGFLIVTKSTQDLSQFEVHLGFRGAQLQCLLQLFFGAGGITEL